MPPRSSPKTALETTSRPEAAAAVADAAEAIRGAGSLALACHHHPDGDALGSMLAMHLLCEANGVESVASWPSPFVVGPQYEFLPGLDRCTPPDAFPADPEVLVTFDLGHTARLGELAPAAERAGQVIVLDHHPDNQRFGTLNVVDTDVAATAVLVRQLAADLGWSLTHDVALNLYVGLVTDTGRFRYPNTTPDVFHFAAELAEYGLPIARITRELFENYRFQYVQLLSMALSRCELDEARGFIVAWVTAHDLEHFDVTFDETEGFIDHVRACDEAEVACVLREAPGEGLRVSLRSTGSIDVSEMAARFGGGGHAFMAGFTTERSIAEVIEDVRALVPVQTERS